MKKNEKGLTLVALIITVVVLLIIAGVAISTINETGIIAKANHAANRFVEEKNKENEALKGYLSNINSAEGQNNGQDENVETKTITFYIDGIEYRAESPTGTFTFVSESYGGDTVFIKVGTGEGNIGYTGYHGAMVEYVKNGAVYYLYDGNRMVYCADTVQSGKNYTIKLMWS